MTLVKPLKFGTCANVLRLLDHVAVDDDHISSKIFQAMPCLLTYIIGKQTVAPANASAA